MKRLMFGMLLVVAAVAGLLCPGTAQGDSLIRQLVHTDAAVMMGQTQPAKDDTVTIWLTKNHASMTGGGSDAIIRLDQSKFYIVNHESKTYSVLPLSFDLASLLPTDDPDAQTTQQMLAMMKATATVTPTAETKKINQWKARRYDVQITSSFMTIAGQTWTAVDSRVDTKAYQALKNAMLSLNPAMKDANAELSKIEGVTILEEQTVTVMGAEMKTRRETVEIKEGSPPAGTYDPPAGYTEKPFNPMEALQHK